MIQTSYRRIVSEIPHPDSVPLIEELARIEPVSMAGFPPVVWDRAVGFQVWDAFGNRWIDFSSAVVLANAGHANPRIAAALRAQIDGELWHSYCNPSEIRLRTVLALAAIAPPALDKVFLLSTGAEAVECALKLMRLHGRSIAPEKIHIVSFLRSFHGRTMGAQMAGGYLDQQEWMGSKPPGFHAIPYPECARCPWGRDHYDACGRECLERGLDGLRERGVPDELVAGVISETFQGPTVAFMPPDYVRALRDWTTDQRALLAFDEIQAGFGRTGRWFGFEHYGVEPDLFVLGKGMTSSLPMSAVIGRGKVLDLAAHGEMSSTHTGNPLCCAAALANIEAIRDDGLMANAAALEPVARRALEALRARFAGRVGAINGRGLVWGVYLLNPAGGEPDVELARSVVTRCMERGLLMLQTGRGTLKIAPPLCIPADAFQEGIRVIEEALGECLRGA
jgi:4-aminobutyrate aminotransferase / (S)-3-amino-2-methylpropionate transaminase / 5-aminovalerate transaminase